MLVFAGEKMENKLGMFIHWGIYASLKCHEQAVARFDMKREDYEKYAEKFNPIKFNPKKWVKLAKVQE